MPLTPIQESQSHYGIVRPDKMAIRPMVNAHGHMCAYRACTKPAVYYLMHERPRGRKSNYRRCEEHAKQDAAELKIAFPFGASEAHPHQPIITDEQGVKRFRANLIVRYLLDAAREAGIADMNTLAVIPFPVEDRVQFAELIGYSVSGLGDLSYVSDEAYKAAGGDA